MKIHQIFLVTILALCCMAQSYNIPFAPGAAGEILATDDFGTDNNFGEWTGWEGTLGTNVDEPSGTADTVSDPNHILMSYTDTSMGSADNWACVQMTATATFGRWGVHVRSNNTDGEGYVGYLKQNNTDRIEWDHYDGASTFTNIASGTDTGTGFSTNNYLCCVVEGQTTATDMTCFEFSSAPVAYSSVTQWEGLGSHVQTFSLADGCGANCVSAGNYAGMYLFDNDTGTTSTDNWSAGAVP